MNYTFFYASAAMVWVIFLLCLFRRKLRVENVIVGVMTVGYSSVFDVLLGGYFGLYYYVQPDKSLLFILLSAMFIYPPLNMTYTLYLPKGALRKLIYTILWIAAMFGFELASLYFKTVVLTGWNIIPWSFVTYAATYLVVNIMFYYVKNRTGSRYY